jgi:Ser-tRNA(Ala) deacylase AlaX
MCINQEGRFHFGLEFVMSASPEEVERAINSLVKKNRGVKISKQDRKLLKSDLERKAKIRRQKENSRRRSYYK